MKMKHDFTEKEREGWLNGDWGQPNAEDNRRVGERMIFVLSNGEMTRDFKITDEYSLSLDEELFARVMDGLWQGRILIPKPYGAKRRWRIVETLKVDRYATIEGENEEEAWEAFDSDDDAFDEWTLNLSPSDFESDRYYGAKQDIVEIEWNEVFGRWDD